MIFEGCQGKASETYLIEKKCPVCGQKVEMFSTDTEVTCDCGNTVYNDTLSCVQWCDHAEECVGEELYKKIMAQNGLAIDREGNIQRDEDEESLNYFSF